MNEELRSTLVATTVTALLFGTLLWAVGLDPVSSAFLGTAVLTAGAGRALLRVAWPRSTRGSTLRRRRIPGGVRLDVVELSWQLTPGRTGVHRRAIERLRALAARRLAGHGVDLDDPSHAAAATRLLGADAYQVLTADPSIPVRLRVFERCLDAVEAIGAPPPRQVHDHRQIAPPVAEPAQELRP